MPVYVNYENVHLIITEARKKIITNNENETKDYFLIKQKNASMLETFYVANFFFFAVVVLRFGCFGFGLSFFAFSKEA